MRGAGLRLDIDVRRVWHCAACGAERRVGAQVTTVRCQCAGRPAMKLVEGMRRERPLKELGSPYLEFIFEPGELAPPRSKEEQAPAPPAIEIASVAETSAERDREENDGGPAPLESAVPRPAPQQRPPRQNDRRGDRAPASARAPQGRNDTGPRPDQPPRRDQSGPRERRPAAAAGEAPKGQKSPPRDQPAGRRNDRRNDRPAPPPAAAENSGFGEGITTEPPTKPQP